MRENEKRKIERKQLGERKKKREIKKKRRMQNTIPLFTIVCIEKGDQIIRSNKSNKTKTENENKKKSSFF